MFKGKIQNRILQFSFKAYIINAQKSSALSPVSLSLLHYTRILAKHDFPALKIKCTHSSNKANRQPAYPPTFHAYKTAIH